MANSYSFKEYGKDNMARAIGRALPISFKQSVEICNFIRNRHINDAKSLLNNVILHKRAVPFRRFKKNVGHKTKIAAGRYPEKACKEILELINSVEANAQFKGLNTANLVIAHINANKAGKTMHFGRKRGRRAKRTNIEIVVHAKAKDAAAKEKSKNESKKT